MVGTDENGDPRCVPDDDVPDAEGFENAVAMDGSGPPTGVTDKTDDGESSAQDSSMSDTDIESRVDTIESTVDDIAEKIDDAVDTDKEPGDGGGALRDLAAELANHEEVAANTDDIMSELKSTFLSDKENDGMGDMDDDEDDDEDMESSASKSAGDDSDATPNYGKGADGSDSAAVAKENDGGGSGLPSYREAMQEAESE
jgi:cell pole-organizing protein PopZ